WNYVLNNSWLSTVSKYFSGSSYNFKIINYNAENISDETHKINIITEDDLLTNHGKKVIIDEINSREQNNIECYRAIYNKIPNENNEMFNEIKSNNQYPIFNKWMTKWIEEKGIPKPDLSINFLRNIKEARIKIDTIINLNSEENFRKLI